MLGALVLALVAPAAAEAAYSGAVDASARTAALTGSGTVAITASGGVLHHAGDLGPGFASGSDFDSSAPGDQVVPDSGRWTVTVPGGGKDTLDLTEGEPASPVTYASGHTFYPGGVPCIVRDPTDRHGITIFSLDPDVETRFCYPSGIARVNVHAGSRDADFTAIDNEK